MLFGATKWIEAVGDTTGSYLDTQYTITAGIVDGSTYLVQVRA